MGKQIQTDDFLKNHILTNFKFDNEQNMGLYFDKTLDLEQNRYKTKVYTVCGRTLESKAFEMPIEPDNYTFTKDGILFIKVQNDETSLYVYNTETLKWNQLCKVPFVIEKIDCFEEKIYFTAKVKDDTQTSVCEVSCHAPFFQENRGVVGTQVTALFQSDLQGKKIRMVTDLDMDVDLVHFDFIHNRIALTIFKHLSLKPVGSCVLTYDLVEETLHIHSDDAYRIDSLCSMSEDILFFAGVHLKTHNRNDNQQVYSIHIDTQEIVQHGGTVDLSNERPGVATDCTFSQGYRDQCFNSTYYHLRLDVDRQVLSCLDLNGCWVHMDTGLKVITGFHVVSNGVFLLGLKEMGLTELFFLKDGVLKQLTNHNQWLETYEIVSPRHMSVHVDNVEVSGWVYLPAQFDSAKKYPGVLMIHGGPKMVYSSVFMFDVQILTAKGYFVFYANPMGSDGKGNQYADIRGRFDCLPYKQLMTFTDGVLKAFSQLDEKRLGVMGGSYGGYMTNVIITKTQRFCAAVSERGISSMAVSHMSSDIGYKFVDEYLNGTGRPWSKLNDFSEVSPLMKADKVTTPTLFIHGKDDYRCHYTESLNMYTALQYHNVPTRLCLYPGENHSLVVKGRPQAKEIRYRELTDWFEQFLKRGK